MLALRRSFSGQFECRVMGRELKGYSELFSKLMMLFKQFDLSFTLEAHIPKSQLEFSGWNTKRGILEDFGRRTWGEGTCTKQGLDFSYIIYIRSHKQVVFEWQPETGGKIPATKVFNFCLENLWSCLILVQCSDPVLEPVRERLFNFVQPLTPHDTLKVELRLEKKKSPWKEKVTLSFLLLLVLLPELKLPLREGHA